MKKSFCFAGFDDREVPTLRAAIAASHTPWECRFVADASTALAAMAGEPFDALVANMSMPGRTGAELLREMRASRPNTLGFIVGEVKDQQLIIDCIGGPHRFIRRPFEPGQLVAGLKRGLTLDAWLATDELRQLAPQLRRLPSLPSTYFNLLKEVESASATTQSIGAVIARDPVVTARLLQMANSAAFSLAQKVTDPVDAVTVLGIETVKSLVLCLQVFSQADEARKAGLSLEILWEHSLLVAKFARQITLRQTGDARLAGDAFTAGLLHDVGRIVLASNLPQEYAAVITGARENGRPLHEEEAASLRVNHAQIGAYLLGLWGLPADFVEATAGHHAPGQTVFAREFSLLTAVHAANVFAHAAGGQTDGLCLPEMDLGYFNTIQLDDQLAVWQECCTGEKPPPSAAKAESAAPPIEKKTPPMARPATHFAYGLIAAMLLLALAGVLVWHFFGQSVPASDSAVANSATNQAAMPPQAAAGNVPPVPTLAQGNVSAAPTGSTPAQPASALDHIRVQGIFYRAASPLAIINGKTFGVGDHFNGIQVVGIDRHSVTLVLNGEQRIFKLN
ncbi:MAG: response regulator [Verrucomicrobiota bacterium]